MINWPIRFIARDQRILSGFGEGVVHALTDAAHLAKKRVGREPCDDELSPFRRHAVNLHRARLQQKEHFTRFIRRVEDAPGFAGLHPCGANNLLHLLEGKVTEQLHR
jgi:hypothetical protein